MDTDRFYHYNYARKSPATWRSAYDFEYSLKSLSKNMKTALKEALQNNNICDASKATVSSLSKRCLCNKKGELSSEGKVVAVSLLPLKKQALELSLPITEIECSFKNRPEIPVREYLLNESGYKHVCFAEGGDILVLLYCMCFDVIWNTWKLHPFFEDCGESNSISFMYTCPLTCDELLEIKPKLYEHLISSIATSKRNKIEKAFKTLRKWHADMGWNEDRWPWQNYVGLSLSFIMALYDTLDNETLVSIAKSYFIDPAAFNKGWPDITAIDQKNKVTLFEVKTSDKFHPSQIITIPAMAPFLKSEVIKIKRKVS